MTFDILKSEVLKLQRTELFDFVQFILHSLKEKEFTVKSIQEYHA